VTGDEPIDIEAVLAQPAEQKENQHDEDPALDLPPDDGDESGGAGGTTDQPLDAACSRRFTAVHTSGTRPLSAIKLIVIHSTEGDTAAGAARWWTNPDSKGSGHLVVDDHECYRALGNEVIPWGAPGANTNGFHLEHAGFAAWHRDKWLQHEQTIRRGAFKVAVHAQKFGVPIRLLSADDLRRGRGGIVTHVTVSEVFHGDHTDPGSGFPLDVFMGFVEEFAQQLSL
jgi:hypothetical protein